MDDLTGVLFHVRWFHMLLKADGCMQFGLALLTGILSLGGLQHASCCISAIMCFLLFC
uniref:Uncharacterized protein n=1 Tax=Arundo donax TaxID=35708 RepID=A0A0A9GCT0_ARUDO